MADPTSPYLALHRDDPVEWMPWGDEVFERARREDKPVLLSIGFSTCYWCQAMARESFRDAGLAALLNREVVSVLVDRDARPDLDQVYMAATQVYSHGGGWPNTLFLNHQRVPYFCGTYFPPVDHAQGPGFRTVVESMVHAWQQRRAEVEEQAAELEPAIRRFLEERGEPGAEIPGPGVAERALAGLAERFDPEWGGFGQGAKFPAPAALHLLQALAPTHPAAAAMLETTLDRMDRGGIHDQLGGGFHRYAGDRQWNRPHFEKMLAENGQLLELYAREYRRTGDPRWWRVARSTADFLLGELALDDGSFAMALGGETAGRPGLTYRWTHDELVAALGKEDAAFLAPILGYDGAPDGGGAYVLNRPRPLAEEAMRRRLEETELAAQIEPLVAKLRKIRGERPFPFRDDQVVAEANGFALAGLVAAGRALDDPTLIESARQAAGAVLDRLGGGEVLYHSGWDGALGEPAFLGDYAALIHGLLALDEAGDPGGDGASLERARRLADEMIARLAHPVGGFVTTAAEDTPWTPRTLYDDALPSAGALALLDLFELARRSGKSHYYDVAERGLRAFAHTVEHEIDSARMLALVCWRFRT